MKNEPKLPDNLPQGIARLLAQAKRIGYTSELGPIPAIAATSIKEGVIEVFVDPRFNEWSNEVKNEVLAHELGGHLLLRTAERRGERDPRLWNACTDASIAHNVCDSALVDRAVGIESITYARLGIPPCRSEIAYDMLKKQQEEKGQSEGEGGGQGTPCGSDCVSQVDGSEATAAVLAEHGPAILADMVAMGLRLAGSGHGAPQPLTGELPQRPEWIRRALALLVAARKRGERVRSWRRYSRTEQELLPGRSRNLGVACTIMIDRSGSIDQDSLMEFVAAVVRTPELRNSEVIAFDDTVSATVPARNANAVRQVAGESRGGTLIRKAGEARRDGVPCVWLTDGVSCDGFPTQHPAGEIWCVIGDATPPTGITVRIR